MNKRFLMGLILICTGLYAAGQSLQFNHYEYSDLYEIEVNQNGKVYIKEIYSDKSEEISVVVDEYGFKKLVNDNYNLFNIDGGAKNFLAQEIPVTKTIEFPDGVYHIPDCQLNGINIKNISASSTLTDKYHTYSPEGTLSAWYTGDCNIWGFVKNNIPWVEGKQDYGIGEYIEFELDNSLYKSGVYDGWNIKILNGYVNPEKPYLFKQNSRIKKATLVIDGNIKQDVYFDDCVEIKTIKIPEYSSRVKLIIDEVYEGTKYMDTCVTGISAEMYINFN